MSATASWDAAGIDVALRDGQLSRYLNLAPFAILFYDYLLTLPTEIERYWSTDFSFRRGTVWFLLCRYISLLGNIPVLIQVIWPVDDQCSTLVAYHQIYIVVSQILVAIMLNIRTYALYERSRRIKWFLWVLSLIVLGVGCWAIVHSRSPAPEEPPEIGCNVATSTSMGYNLAIAWGGLLCYDITIFSLTLAKAFSLRGGSRTLADIILRDGTMYFGVIACSTSTALFTFAFARPLIKGLTSTLTNVLSTTLIARLMLNIRDPQIVQQNFDPSRSRNTSSGLGSDELVVSSAFDTARLGWTEPSRSDPEAQGAAATHGARHDVIELVRRDHLPQKAGQAVSWGGSGISASQTLSVGESEV